MPQQKETTGIHQLKRRIALRTKGKNLFVVNGFICISQQIRFLQNLLKGVWHHEAFHQGPQTGLCFKLLQKNRTNILLPLSRMFSEGRTRYPLYLKGRKDHITPGKNVKLPVFTGFFIIITFLNHVDGLKAFPHPS